MSAVITYIAHDGAEHPVTVETGGSVMEAAVQAGVPGIEAECGGACACATCHVYVDPNWFDKLPPIEEMEESMLDFVPTLGDTSRLSCQLTVTDALDGLIVRLPESQY